jgi:serine/threonine protein kinase
LKIGKELGRGAVGVVYEAFWKSGGRSVAVKRLSADVDELTLEEFSREVAVHSIIHHPNIVRVFAGCAEPPNCYLVLELCAGGSLSDLILDATRQLPWTVRVAWSIDIAKGLGRFCIHFQKQKLLFNL